MAWALLEAVAGTAFAASPDAAYSKTSCAVGSERALCFRLAEGDEYRLSPDALAGWGRRIFRARWTVQDGAGRPRSKGNGQPLSDPSSPLTEGKAMNRISGPDANSCEGCHNAPYGTPGGSGDFAAGVFVLGQRFDFVTFDRTDTIPTRGAVDEQQRPITLQDAGNFRRSPGLFGAGYIEMLAREMTGDLIDIRNSIRPGESCSLASKGISFGTLARNRDGSWDTSRVTGLSAASLVSAPPVDPMSPPSLVVRPWGQAGAFVSLREFTNAAFNQHFGMQSAERFGRDTDPDGDGIANELNGAEITAIVLYQAGLPVPGRVVADRPEVRRAVRMGEQVFRRIGCVSCHVPALLLSRRGIVFTEPNPFNPPGNLRSGGVRSVSLNLLDRALPAPRLASGGSREAAIEVPLYSDLKLHDICGASGAEPLDQNQPDWSPRFRRGNCRFLTARLWGAGNQPPYFHDGRFTTLRQAVFAHHGEAEGSRLAFLESSSFERDDLIEFLKSLQVLPPGTRTRVVDERFLPARRLSP